MGRYVEIWGDMGRYEEICIARGGYQCARELPGRAGVTRARGGNQGARVLPGRAGVTQK